MAKNKRPDVHLTNPFKLSRQQLIEAHPFVETDLGDAPLKAELDAEGRVRIKVDSTELVLTHDGQLDQLREFLRYLENAGYSIE